MDLKQIEKLMAAMEKSGTTELGIKKEGFELLLKRAEPKNCQMIHSTVSYSDDHSERIEPAFQRHQASLTLSGKETQSLAQTGSKSIEDTNSLYITSPMVGTFYSTPSPEEPPFVKVGDRVEKNTVVCIVEAMKVMNEVKSGVSGVVAEILIDNSHPVEFGSKLFRITPQ